MADPAPISSTSVAPAKPKSGGMYGGDGSESGGFDFNAPVHFGSMFGPDSDDESNSAAQASDDPIYDIQTHAFPDQKILRIRQFDDHVTNANAVWPEARFLAGWLCGEKEDGSIDRGRLQRMLIEDPSAASAPVAAASSSPSVAAPLPPSRRKRVLELGAACGALSIFLCQEGVDMTASDIDDAVVTNNIRTNAIANGLQCELPVAAEAAAASPASVVAASPPLTLKLLPHSWGHSLSALDSFAARFGRFDVIVASDILNYEKEFDNLVLTLSRLMPRPGEAASSSSPCVFYMVWKRRARGRDQERSFFDLLQAAHFHVETEGQKVFEITRI